MTQLSQKKYGELKKQDDFYYSHSYCSFQPYFLYSLSYFVATYFGMLLYLSYVISVLVSICSSVWLMLGCNLLLKTKNQNTTNPKQTNKNFPIFPFPIFNIFYSFWFADLGFYVSEKTNLKFYYNITFNAKHRY